MTIDTQPRRSRGRPREFEESRALDGAIALFCAAGFSAASIANLTKATGLTTGSLYKAYRDKEGLFARALDRYVALRDKHIASDLQHAESGRSRIERLLGLYAGLSQGEEGQRGCMVIAGMSELGQLGDTADVLRTTLARRRAMLCKLIMEGQRDGSILTTDGPEQAADLLLALLQGMRVLGKGGLFPKDSDGFVRGALKLLD